MESAEFKRGAGAAEKRIEQMQRRIQAASAVIGAALGGALGAFTKQAIEGAVAQQQAVAQVEAAITSMGNAAGRTSAQLVETADALEMRSLFDADVILKQVTANLLTFGNVAGEQFDRAQQAALDMATRLRGEPQAAAIMLGKALNDPVQGITALQKAGVKLTDDQKALIASMVELGDVAGAQNIILAEVERQFRDAAAAAADATPWRAFQVIVGQISDVLGDALLPSLNMLRDYLLANRAQIVSAAQGAVQFAGSLVGLVQALSPLLAGFVAYRATLIAVAVAQGTYTAAMILATRAIGAAQAGTIALNFAMAANPFGAVAVAVGVLTAAFLGMRQAQAQARVETDNLIGSLKALAGARGADFISKRNEAVVSLLTKQSELARLERQLGGQKGVGAGYAAQALGPKITALRSEIADLDKGISQADKAAKDAAKAMQGIAVPTANAGSAAAAAAGPVRDLGGAARSQADAFQALYDRLFPYQAASRKFAEEMALIQRSRLSDAEKELAITRLEAESFRNRTSGLGDAPVSDRLRNEGPLVDFRKQFDELQATLEDGASKAKAQTVVIAQSFADMARNITSSLQGLTNSIRSGDFLGILGGLLEIFTTLGSAGVFGSGLQGRLNRVPGNANGTRSFAGGLSVVGERGPELVNLPRRSQVIPNHKLSGMGGGAIAQIVPSPYFNVVVDGRIVQSAPAVANLGAQQARGMAAKSARRRVR